jgi:hypothetical protein
MNLVERFFGDLTAFITEKRFASTREPANATITFLADRNDNPRRYVWKAEGEIQYTRGAKDSQAAAISLSRDEARCGTKKEI